MNGWHKKNREIFIESISNFSLFCSKILSRVRDATRHLNSQLQKKITDLLSKEAPGDC